VPGVVADTNLLVSAFLARSADTTPRRAFRLAHKRFRLCLSSAMLDELHDVLARPKFRRLGASVESIALFLALIEEVATVVVPDRRVTDCRDPADNMVLEAALAGSAEAIVTGDADLLALDPWRGIAILSPAAFVARFDPAPPP
jgi:putative PIN family toxin of toxin-antitoxin system